MGLSSRKGRMQRVLQISVTADVSSNNFVLGSLKQGRDGIDGDLNDIANETSGTNPFYIELGEAIPAGTIIVLTGTIQA